jgi:nucleolar protein 14
MKEIKSRACRAFIHHSRLDLSEKDPKHHNHHPKNESVIEAKTPQQNKATPSTMGKRKNRSKRSVTRTPKGVPHKQDAAANPFEANGHRSAKRPKFQVLNRHSGGVAAPSSSYYGKPGKSGSNTTGASSFQPNNKKQSALANAVQQRREMIRSERKVNVFRDHRLLHENNNGHDNNADNDDDRRLARIVKERSNQSKRARKYQLDDEVVLTHRGQALGDSSHYDADHDKDDIFLTEQEEGAAVGELDEADTSLHFGGHRDATNSSSYGRTDLATQYLSRKTELDDLIMRRKLMKAEKQKSKGTQEDVFTELDDQFKELSQFLDFRDKEKYEQERFLAKRSGTLNVQDVEMDEWDLEMKQYLATSNEKVKATDRTKTDEEIAQNEADRLHALETRRLARMHGDFDNDDLSDVDVHYVAATANGSSLPPESIVDGENDPQKKKTGPSVLFTADGLVNVDEDGNITGKFGEESDDDAANDDESDASSDDDEEEEDEPEEEVRRAPKTLHRVGAKVMASYRAEEQDDGGASWFSGTVVKVHAPLLAYDIQYDDGDFEEKVKHVHIQHMERDNSAEQQQGDDVMEPVEDDALLRKKRAIAKEKARYDSFRPR